MDQGVAAVLGASVGVVGALGAATLTYIATRKQAVDQGVVDFRKSLRSERREAYLAFMQAVEGLHPVLVALGWHGEITAAESPLSRAEQISTLRSLVRDLCRLQAQIDLVGPTEVERAAVEVWGRIADLRSAVEREPTPSHDGSRPAGVDLILDSLEDARSAFSVTARRVLETPF
ncbi:hypothetical protein [Streptomyces cyanogenus]|uniref:hypothetical protein n=1 Tax=Streptomyces cyanogenus TaxID=80860 RepID=UPI001AA16425|nr:hypothetical protein [Streptomyces cyanogenus]